MNVFGEYATDIAGAVGGLISLVFADKLGAVSRVVWIFGGWASARYLAPWGLYWLGIDDPGGGAYFLFGLFGMAVASALMRTITALDLTKIIEGWLKK